MHDRAGGQDGKWGEAWTLQAHPQPCASSSKASSPKGSITSPNSKTNRIPCSNAWACGEHFSLSLPLWPSLLIHSGEELEYECHMYRWSPEPLDGFLSRRTASSSHILPKETAGCHFPGIVLMEPTRHLFVPFRFVSTWLRPQPLMQFDKYWTFLLCLLGPFPCEFLWVQFAIHGLQLFSPQWPFFCLLSQLLRHVSTESGWL